MVVIFLTYLLFLKLIENDQKKVSTLQSWSKQKKLLFASGKGSSQIRPAALNQLSWIGALAIHLRCLL